MNKILLAVAVVLTFLTTSASADALKNTLLNIKSKNDSLDMMGLGDVGLNSKAKHSAQVMKKRSPKAVLATVNGHKIRKKDADAYLKKVTKGKIKDFDRLPKKQQKLLLSDLKKIYKIKYFKGRPPKTVIGHYDDNSSVYKKEADVYIKKITKGKIDDIDRLPRKQRILVLKDLQRIHRIKNFKSRPKDTIITTVNMHIISKEDADNYIAKATNGNIKDFDLLDEERKKLVINALVGPILLSDEAQNSLTSEEKDEILKQMWLEKQRANTDVSNEEILAFYEAMKKETLAKDPNAKIPPYISLGANFKKRVIDKKIMDELTKDINITVNYDAVEDQDQNDSNKTLETSGKIVQ